MKTYKTISDMVDEIIVPHDFSIFDGAFEPRRDCCETCRRPCGVCICNPTVGQNKMATSSKIIILKHPSEEKRSLTTVPLLQMGLTPESCHVFVGVSFNLNIPESLKELLNTHRCFLVYPTRDAELLEDVVSPGEEKCAFIFLDASWRRVKSLFTKNRNWLSKLPCVKLKSSQLSQYVIRTQPNDQCVSTLEAAAMVLNHMECEKYPNIFEDLTEPLRTLCQHQLNHGAQKHESKQQKRLYDRDAAKLIEIADTND